MYICKEENTGDQHFLFFPSREKKKTPVFSSLHKMIFKTFEFLIFPKCFQKPSWASLPKKELIKAENSLKNNKVIQDV